MCNFNWYKNFLLPHQLSVVTNIFFLHSCLFVFVCIYETSVSSSFNFLLWDLCFPLCFYTCKDFPADMFLSSYHLRAIMYFMQIILFPTPTIFILNIIRTTLIVGFVNARTDRVAQKKNPCHCVCQWILSWNCLSHFSSQSRVMVLNALPTGTPTVPSMTTII